MPPKKGYSHLPKTKLARRRAGTGMSQDEVAAAAGVGKRTLQRLEQGEVPQGVYDLVALAELYGCTLDELVEDAWKPRKRPQ